MESELPVQPPLEATESGGGESVIVISKEELLEAIQKIRGILLEYGLVVENIAETEEWNQQALDVIRSHQSLFGNGSSPLSKMDLMIGLFYFLVSRIKQEQFVFKVPARTAMIREEENSELEEFSKHLKGLKPSTENLVSKVLALANSEEIRSQDKVHSLLVAIASFFKGMIRQDWEDVALIITHINLVTISPESHNLVGHIAKIARTIYNSLNEFSEFFTVESLSHSTEELPDAVEKLRKVIVKLEEAANTNLDSLEQLNAEVSQTGEWARKAQEVLAQCESKLESLQNTHPELAESVAKIREELARDVTTELGNLQRMGVEEGKSYLSLIANQSFQDLTGQTLKKVITFIESLQFKLVDLLPHAVTKTASGESGMQEQSERAPGKVAMQSQENVDQLLADLGF